jgi:hypothetical protein
MLGIMTPSPLDYTIGIEVDFGGGLNPGGAVV